MEIAVITLHKVVNCGSALQAYALQEYLKKLTGGNVFLIDYKFPNKFHKKNRKPLTFLKRVKVKMGLLKRYLLENRGQMDNKFNNFWNSYFNLSNRSYNSIAEIMETPPMADLYITGSDQVWNVNSLCNDPVMYCQFAPIGKKKISFAASFTVDNLPEKYKVDCKNWLCDYSAIGVREKSSLLILKDLGIKDIPLFNTCDPTLLLDSVDYHELAQKSTINIDGEYIFVYYLSYAYNPEPAISKIIKEIVDSTGLKVVVLSDKKIKYKGNYLKVTGVGPCEFIYLFKNAKYVVTSSFHGTMFSTIYRKAFYTILPPGVNPDSRTSDFLKVLNIENRGIKADDTNYSICLSNPFNMETESKLNCYIENSKQFLKKSIYG